MQNKYYVKGAKAKELFNHDNEYNPFTEGTREYLLWMIGNQRSEYIPVNDEVFVEERNSEIIDKEDYDIHKG